MTIRKQIIGSLLAMAIILQISIFSVLIISMEFIKDLCTKEIEIMNKNITEKQMHLIAKYNNILKISNYRQKGFFVDYIRSNYGANIFILKYLLDEIKDYGSALNLQNFETYKYDELYAKYNESFIYNFDKYGKYPINLEHSVIWKAKDSVDSDEGNLFIYVTSHLDSFYKSLFNTSLYKENIPRINIVYAYQKTKLMRIWPAQKILNENYDIYGKNTEDETFFDWSTQIFQVVNQNNTKNVVADFPFCILNGPYLDVKTYLTPTISMNSLLIMNNGFKGIIQAELKLLIFQDIIEEMKFMKTGFLLSFNLVGRFINYPIYWIELNDKNQNLLIYNYTYRTGVSFDYYNETLDKTQENNEKLREIKILDNYFNEKQYYVSTVLLPYNYAKESVFRRWEFGLFLYVEKSEVDKIKISINLMIEKHSRLVFFALCIQSSLTLSLVLLLCYYVARSISKPLKKVTEISNFINENAASKKSLENISLLLDEIPAGEYQLSQLIHVFKKFVRQFEGKKDNSIIIKKPLNYPFNSLNKEFINKTRNGKTPINWKNLIDNIIEQEKDEELEFESEDTDNDNNNN